MKKFLFAIVLWSLFISAAFAATAADYREAAEKGDAKAQFNLGNCYFNGWGVSKNMAEAVKWYKKAARQGIPNAKKALNNLGETW